MPKKAVKKRHVVDAKVQIFDLSKAGTSLELEVYSHEARKSRTKLGSVVIGRGSVSWKKGNERPHRAPWPKFIEMMESL